MSYILGISESHTASACLLKNGEIIACASEERFTRIKLQAGIPKNAILWCLKFAQIDFGDLEKVVLADTTPPVFSHNPHPNPYAPHPKLLFDLEEKLELRFPVLRLFFYNIYNHYNRYSNYNFQKNRLKKLKAVIPLSDDKFIFLPHHLCHAAAALFSSGFAVNPHPVLVFTADGVGDFESAALWRFKNNRLEKLQSIDSQQSLGFFYQHITGYLGLKMNEDEYKVMGLAPYADPKKSENTYQTLKEFFRFDKTKNRWVIKVSEIHLYRHLPEILKFHRFDHIAYAAQKILEKMITAWVASSIRKYNIPDIVCGGGVFANIKLNQKIAQLSDLRKAFFMPSPGDESNALGAAYYYSFLTSLNAPNPLKSLYLGPSYSDQKVLSALRKLSKPKFSVRKFKNINIEVAKLLAKGEIVARFAGRMEFGARALGNRSILANPQLPQLPEFLNQAIKNRDFWMPFAPTILDYRSRDYTTPHKADSRFMNVSFDTTNQAKVDLYGAIHPYDKTTRPQILNKETNPGYYDLIKEFEGLTGIGAVLNTSFNLHGEPIVCAPEDALRVFKLSGLKYLVLENWLIKKI